MQQQARFKGVMRGGRGMEAGVLARNAHGRCWIFTREPVRALRESIVAASTTKLFVGLIFCPILPRFSSSLLLFLLLLLSFLSFHISFSPKP